MLPKLGECLGLRSVTVRAKAFKRRVGRRRIRLPSIGAKKVEHKNIGVRRFRPENIPPAERVRFGDFLPRRDKIVTAANIERRLIGEKNPENVGEFTDHAPIRKVVRRIPVRRVIPKNRPRGVRFGEKAARLLRLPGIEEIPPGEQKRRVRIMPAQQFGQPPIGVELHFQIVGAVLIAVPLGDANRMEQLGPAVIRDMRGGQFPVILQIHVVPNIPDQSGRLAVAARRLRQKRRMHRIEKLLRRSAVPMAHRAEIFRVHQIALKGVVENHFAQFAPIFERPKKRPVIVPPERFGNRFGWVRIIDDFRERLLKNIVMTNPEHKKIEPLFEHPVDFPPPLVRSPMLRLKTKESAMGEIAQSAIVKTGGFRCVEPGKIERFSLRYDVAVPKPAAAGAPLEKVVNRVER